MIIDIPMEAIIGSIVFVGASLLGAILIYTSRRIDKRNDERKIERIQQTIENLQIEKETELRERTITEELLPPEWLIMYDACKNAGDRSARRIWINTLLTQNNTLLTPTLPKLPMTAIANFAQLVAREDGYAGDGMIEQITENLAEQYLQLPEINKTTSEELPDTFSEYCENILDRTEPQKLDKPKLPDPGAALFVKERVPAKWYEFYAEAKSILRHSSRRNFCRYKLRSGALQKDSDGLALTRPSSSIELSAEQAWILANALAMDEEGKADECDVNEYVTELIPFVESPGQKRCIYCAIPEETREMSRCQCCTSKQKADWEIEKTRARL